jgi:hypothetical protein
MGVGRAGNVARERRFSARLIGDRWPLRGLLNIIYLECNHQRFSVSCAPFTTLLFAIYVAIYADLFFLLAAMLLSKKPPTRLQRLTIPIQSLCLAVQTHR